MVEQRVRLLDPRCHDEPQRERLRKATTQWTVNGGTLPSAKLAVEPVSEDRDETQPLVPQHAILEKGFRLHARAMMLTYNSRSFTPETWEASPHILI